MLVFPVVVQEHEESFDANDMRDIIDMFMLEVRQHGEVETAEGEAAFSRKTMWKIIYDLFIAGTDTTANTLMWLLLFMAVHPDVQKRVSFDPNLFLELTAVRLNLPIKHNTLADPGAKGAIARLKLEKRKQKIGKEKEKTKE